MMEGLGHDWSGDGEKCNRCGDPDWCADKYCSKAIAEHLESKGWQKTIHGWSYTQGFDADRMSADDALKLQNMIDNWGREPDEQHAATQKTKG